MFFWIFQERFIFKPHLAQVLENLPDGYISLCLEGDPSTQGLWVPSHDKNSPVVVFMHGNSSSVDQQEVVIRGYHQRGYGVLLPEYPGYGRSSGTPNQANIIQALLRFMDLSKKFIDNRPLIYHGFSIGGGVACALALQYPPRRIILESTFSSIIEMSKGKGIPSILFRNPFLNKTSLLQMKDLLVLIFHGSEDSEIPVQQARSMAKLRSGIEYHEYPVGHHGLRESSYADDYWKHIEEFLSPVRNKH